MNKFQEEVNNWLKGEISKYLNKEKLNFNENVKFFLDTLDKIEIIAKFDLLDENISVERMSESSIGIYFDLGRGHKIAVIINSSGYVIYNKKGLHEEWTEHYVDNKNELLYWLEQYL